MNEMLDILILYLPYEIVHKILFYYQGLQHPIAKILHQTCSHLQTNYSTLLNSEEKTKRCQCQTEIILKWTFPSPLAIDLEDYYKINKFDSSFPYEPRKKNQETRVRWIFVGYHKKYIFGKIKMIQ